MLIKKHLSYFFCVLFIAAFSQAKAQDDYNRLPQQRSNVGYDNQGRPVKQNTGGDSLIHRNPLEDSITIYYHYFDSTRVRFLDSSVSDFYNRFPVPYYYVDLGNLGTPAHSLFFNPVMKPGFDAGFHAFDIYSYKLENTRFFTTTRPYTELNYILGSKAEQSGNILHTQNRKNNLNLVFEYRFFVSPGQIQNQNVNLSSLRLNTDFQSKNKRYGLNFIYINNRLRSSENGGLRDDSKLDSLSLGDPYEADVRLGDSISLQRNIFNTGVTIGESYKENTFFLQQRYDFGQKDSVVTDSVTYRLFYPRLRLQHTLRYSDNIYNYHDNRVDSLDYATYFKYAVPANHRAVDTLVFQDQWKELTNEFSIITYPQKNNLSQFLRLSAAYQNLKGTFDSTDRKTFNNIYASAEYRNRTKNQKWDVDATGTLYLTGDYAGDYSAYISLQRMLSKRLGYLEIGLQDVNRTPSFVNNKLSAFPVITAGSYNKENIARLFANIVMPQQNLRLSGSYYAVTNYVYFDSFYHSNQESTLFNVLNVGLEKKIKLSKLFNWYTEVYLQKATGNAPVNLPLIFTRNRLALEGHFYQNLYLSTGIEIRYYSPYKADNYSPLTGQFFYQNTLTTNNRPDINYYLNFRIKSFKGYLRAENLNTLNFAGKNGIGFTRHNFNTPHYPSQGLWIRVGIWWSFVN